MGTFTQTNRSMAVSTPLAPDVFLLAGFTGHEGVSQLFSFQLDLLVENTRVGGNFGPGEIKFESLLGKSISVRLNLPGGGKRYFNGICSRITQGEMDCTFTQYFMEVVPKLWLLTRNAQSRIFQPPESTVPDILEKILKDEWKLEVEGLRGLAGPWHPRDFCVQYRETDFNFVSRLMEEEGIYYYFKHDDKGHTMIVGNTAKAHVETPIADCIRYRNDDDDHREEGSIHDWAKDQQMRSGKYTLRDYCFERPKASLEFTQEIQPEVTVGTITHSLNRINTRLEIYDFPGEYAQRFDGVQRAGGDQAGDLSKIDGETKRTAKVRMEEEAVAGLTIRGASRCGQMSAGHRFTLERHFNADGPYVLTSVGHSAREPSYRTGKNEWSAYQNSFTCIPLELPFRPPRVTPKPLIAGTQSAFVVGSGGQGEEIFTDKYGRVKVRFLWDRREKGDSARPIQSDADRSCWIRVGTPWAGQQWGMIHIPRIGQEVIVAFEEGDPDKPIIVGSVFNYDNMPPYPLPEHMTQSGIKSHSSLKGGAKNFSELRFEDKKGSEDIYFHAERDFHRLVEHDDDLKVLNNQTVEIAKHRTQTVKEGNETITIEKGNRTETVKEGDETVTVEKGNRLIAVNTGNDTHQIKQGNRDVQIEMGNDTLTIKMGDQTTKVNLGKSETEALQSIELKVGQSSIKLDQTGVTIQGMLISIEGQVQTEVKGLMTTVKGDAMLTAKGGITMIN
jgi:type VI secretion system secreted protein VgrG